MADFLTLWFEHLVPAPQAVARTRGASFCAPLVLLGRPVLRLWLNSAPAEARLASGTRPVRSPAPARRALTQRIIGRSGGVRSWVTTTDFRSDLRTLPHPPYSVSHLVIAATVDDRADHLSSLFDTLRPFGANGRLAVGERGPIAVSPLLLRRRHPEFAIVAAAAAGGLIVSDGQSLPSPPMQMGIMVRAGGSTSS